MRLSLVTLLAAVVLTGCSSEAPDPAPAESPSAEESSSSAPTPPPPPPKAGACYDLTVAAADDASSDADPVPCTKDHTARTVHVGRLAALGAGDSVTDPRVGRRLATECPRRVDAFLGGDPVTRNLSRFVAIWFVPTDAEAEAGAAWYRCDVVAFGRDDAFAALPQQRLEGVLAADGALDTFGTCGTSAPGSPGFERVICSLPHTWRALTTLRIADSARYPGVAKVRSSGDGACADYVESQAGFTTEIDYGWEWPTEAQWETGQRYGFCWAPA
ncbi:hypothetical protein G7072_05380 [Nocardioides sp. HDW12B]|uniref:septum formation family protein n=1 Tax=Nocardioides sp. HDW12B TaxID=2714939 RepID=UPI001408EB4F|nr:septum formation family protein [Nocardioides sp. HDW12B]QIK65837.1 hypothetical protein G7072_05380 [Nocardioides sp. HDW12B]